VVRSCGTERRAFGGGPTFTIELLSVDWDDRDNPTAVHRVPSHAARLADAFMVAKSLFEDGKHSANAYCIKDDDGKVVVRSWERSL
jgi:hypothetical protein